MLAFTLAVANNRFGLFGVDPWSKHYKKEFGYSPKTKTRSIVMFPTHFNLARSLFPALPDPPFPGSCLGTHCLGGSASRVECLHVITICMIVLFNSASANAQTVDLLQSRDVKPKEELNVEGAILKTIESTSVAAQVSGMVVALNVKEGSKVKLNQELGRVRDNAVRLQMEKSKLSIAIAEKKQRNDIDKRLADKNRAVAENEYKRAIEANLLVRDVYPLNEVDRLKLLFDRAVLESERAVHLQSMAALEVSLAEMEHKLSVDLSQRHRIIAPCEGVVIATEKRIGEWVEPGTVVLKIVQIDKLRIEGFISAIDASPELVGKTARVLVEGTVPPIETSAQLVFISPEANPLNSQVRVFLEVENAEGKLRPGLRPTTIIRRLP